MGMWRPEVDFSRPPSLSTSALETGSLPGPWMAFVQLAGQPVDSRNLLVSAPSVMKARFPA